MAALEDLTDEELAQALVCCADDDFEACRRCPATEIFTSGACCFNLVRRAAAARLRKAVRDG